MKNMFTLKNLLRACFAVVLFLSYSSQTRAQVPLNWATLGTTHMENTNTVQPPPFDDTMYFDGVIHGYPRTVDSFSFVNAGQTIKIWWDFGSAIDFIDKIVLYKNQRPITSFMLIRYDALNAVYDTLGTYYTTDHDIADSIRVRIPINDFPLVDTIYIADVQGPQGTPDSREIELWTFPKIPNAVLGANIYGGVEKDSRSAGPGYGPNTINLCPGYSAFLGAFPQVDSLWHYYQWQINTGPGWTNIPGATKWDYIYEGLISANFRIMDSVSGAATAVPSNNTIQVTLPAFNSFFTPLPVSGYVMNFDNTWLSNTCLPVIYNGDIPGNNWGNNDPYGFTSWRRNDVTASTTPNSWAPSSWPAIPGSTTPTMPNTSFPYGVNFGAGNKYARAHTAHPSFDTARTANLDLYLDMSAINGDKALTFYYLNQGPVNNDSLHVLLSTNAGQTWTKLGTYDTAQAWKKRFLPIVSNSAQTVIRFQATKSTLSTNLNTDIGLDSVFVIGLCSGTPNAGKIKSNLSFAKTVSVCPGTSLELTTLGSTIAGGLVYEWQHSYDLGSTFTAVNGGTGSNSNLFFQTPPIYDTVLYRLALKCGPAGTVVYSDTLRVNLSSPGPIYASIPYSQSFETWGNGCSTGDVVLSANNVRNWANTHIPGVTFQNTSWRKSTPEPTTTIWNIGNGIGWLSAGYPTAPPHGVAAARFHSNGAFNNHKGNLDLLFDGSSVVGDKELRFYYINGGGNDSFQVFYSADSGRNFNKLAGYNVVPQWTQFALQVPCSSPKCVIRFQGSGEIANQSDIGLDSVTITPPCTGTPSAGILNSSDTLPCPGETFTLGLVNFSNTGGLSFYWEERPASSPFWTQSQADTTKTFLVKNINVPTWFKVRVKCRYTGMVDSVLLLMNVAPFYYCYCTSSSNISTGADIGNVNIKRLPAGTNLLNNGTATPQNNNPLANGLYADYRVGNPAGWLPLNPAPSTYPTPIYHDTSYQLLVSQINSGGFTPSTVTVWIDTNRNGLFDINEVFLQQTTSLTSIPSQRVDAYVTMPDTTQVGITGMRVMIEHGASVNSVPCGLIGNGEVEDYLVDIRYHPCTGPASAGTVNVSDSSVCANYAVTLTDINHANKQHGLRWVWQYSPDSNSWADLPGSLMKDTMQHVVTAQTWYRLRMVCLMTFDTTYSNVVKVGINPGYACYCYSLATGAAKDSSDIGGLAVSGSAGSGIFIPSVGPHLMNLWALQSRTDYTNVDTLHLWLDSSYQFLVYHTMNTPTHADAKITLFMDLNNDNIYNITNNPQTTERLWTGFTTSTYFTVVDSITIPTYAIPGVLTGMRVILNNDVAPNIPSDSACGPYFSGETEDFVVMFHNLANPWPLTGVKNVTSNVTNLYIYPNPTEGKLTVRFEAKADVDDATITVTNLTGQQIASRRILKPGKKLTEQMDLSNLAKGVYLVELKADNERLIRKLIVK